MYGGFHAQHPYVHLLAQHVISNYQVCDEECYHKYKKMTKWDIGESLYGTQHRRYISLWFTTVVTYTSCSIDLA